MRSAELKKKAGRDAKATTRRGSRPSIPHSEFPIPHSLMNLTYDPAGVFLPQHGLTKDDLAKLDKPLDEIYDWSIDIMSDQFDPKYVKELLKKYNHKTIDDVLMNQDVFSGVGNKIRNESLYLAGIHPQSLVGKIPPEKIATLVKQVVKYAKTFYNHLEKKGEHKDFKVYKQEYAADGSEVTLKVLPKTKRKLYFSEHAQKLYK